MDSNAVAKLRDIPKRVPQLRAAAIVPSPNHASNLSVIRTVEGLHGLQTAWRNLELNNATVFQSYDWAAAWCAAYLDKNGSSELFIITGQMNDATVFILPLVKVRKFGITTLDWLTYPIGQYGDALCEQKQNIEYWMELAFAKITDMCVVDIVRLRHVRDTSSIMSFAKRYLHDASYNEHAPYLDLTSFKSEPDYEARYTATQRKRRKKIRKSLEGIGPVQFTVVSPGTESDRAIDQSMIEKNAWLLDRGRFNRVIGCPKHRAFLKNLAQNSAPNFKMIMTELKAGEKPISWEIGFRFRGTHFAYITSHVNALTNLSPGRLHMDLSQRMALAEGQNLFDLMVPNDAHKESWSSAAIPINDYFLPLSLMGWIYGVGYLATLRPLLRKIYYKLPTKALLALQSITRL